MPDVNGSAQLRALSLRLKAAPAALRVQLPRGIRAAAAPLVADVKQAAMDRLPHGGGLNAQVAGQKVTVSVRTGARTAGVRLTTSAPDTAMTDSGFVRHPTFGRRARGQWRTQQIPNAAGWWSETLTNESPKVTPAVLAVMESVGGMIQGHGL